MKISGLISIVLVLLSTLPLRLNAAPCVSDTESCTEWINLHGSSRSLVYRTYPLETRNENIKRALIMIHGANRDADNYYRNALAAAFLGSALDDTLVIAPRFASNKYGAHPKVTVVHLCGHNARCMYTSEEALPIIFPKE